MTTLTTPAALASPPPTRRRRVSGSRGVLVLRYLDDLPVPAVAAALGRTRQATEVLISRARAAFRREYEQRGGDDG